MFETIFIISIVFLSNFYKLHSHNHQMRLLVVVKLLTAKDRILKYTTEASSANGYYMIPIYNKGEYILRVEPPPGWSFEPNEVQVNVNGQTDACTKNEDINFHFKGFGLSGKVITYGDYENENGPSNVQLQLINQKDKVVVGETSSLKDGSYYFSNIMPGDYEIEAKHATLKFKQNKVKVTLSKDNWSPKESIVVLGYTIDGYVVTKDKKPLKNVVVYLSFSTKPTKALSTAAFDCEKASNDQATICSKRTDSNGRFEFNNIAYGHYRLTAKYESDNVQYALKPDLINVDLVQHKSVSVNEQFTLNQATVKFSLFLTDKKPLRSQTKVYLNNQLIETLQVTSNQFELKNLDSGRYTLKFESDNVFFDDAVVFDVDLTQKSLEDKTLTKALNVYVKAYNVCGSIKLKQNLQEFKNLNKELQIEVLDAKKSRLSTVGLIGDSLSYCVRLNKNTEYFLRPVITNEKLNEVLRLVPTEKQVKLQDAPLLEQNFEQFEAKLNGFVEFLTQSDCKSDFKVQLKSLKTNWQKDVQLDCSQLKPNQNRIKFEIDNIAYGVGSTYALTTNYDNTYCWSENSYNNLNLNGDLKEISLKHVGYRVQVKFDFDVTKRPVKLELNSQEFSLANGGLCLNKKTNYKINLNADKSLCHQFKTENKFVNELGNNQFELNENFFQNLNENQWEFVTFKYRLTIEVEPDRPINEILSVDILNIENVLVEKITLKQQGSLLTGLTWLKSNEQFRVVPQSDKYLFEPLAQDNFQINTNDCSLNRIRFKANLGYFIIGSFKQAEINDIQMRVRNRANDEILSETLVNSKTGYKLGPFKAEFLETVNVELVKDGFVIKQEQATQQKTADIGNLINEYSVDKLGELAVHVRLANTNDNILVSLSSSNKKFRKTLKTDANGDVRFLNLESGTYYLLFMMQEYEFEPNSQSIEILNGNFVQVNVNAKRVAYSCFGKINTINGLAEENVLVEAVGLEKCRSLQESAQSELQNGQYRIRGLKPNCKYQIRLANQNDKYTRIIPDRYEIIVGDVDVLDRNFVVFENLNQCDVSLYVSGIASNSDSHTVRSLIKNFVRVKLFRLHQPDTPVQTQTAPANTIVHFNALQRDPNQSYFVQVELLAASTNIQQSPVMDKREIQFTCDNLFKHLTVNFDVDKRDVNSDGTFSGSIEQLQLTTSFMLPFLIIFAVLFYFKSKEVQSILDMLKERFDDFVTKPRQQTSANSNRSTNNTNKQRASNKVTPVNSGTATSSDTEATSFKQRVAGNGNKSDVNSEDDGFGSDDQAVQRKNRARRA